MNISTIIARKGEQFESIGIGTDSRSLKEDFKSIDETYGFDEIMLIDSRSGKVRGKKFAQAIEAPKKGKKPRIPKKVIDEINDPGLADVKETPKGDEPDFNE